MEYSNEEWENIVGDIKWSTQYIPTSAFADGDSRDITLKIDDPQVLGYLRNNIMRSLDKAYRIGLENVEPEENLREDGLL